MVYDLLQKPPTPGTPMESLMLLVWRMRQDIELQRTRVLANAIITSGQAGADNDRLLRDSWKEYKDALLPYTKIQTLTQDQRAIDFLKGEAGRGPLKVIPLQGLGHTSASRRRSRIRQ